MRAVDECVACQGKHLEEFGGKIYGMPQFICVTCGSEHVAIATPGIPQIVYELTRHWSRKERFEGFGGQSWRVIDL